MKVKIEISGVQENKEYLIQFSINKEDGKPITRSKVRETVEEPKPKKPQKLSIEDFEEPSPKPTIDDVKVKREFKVESSFNGKIQPD